MTHTTVTVSPFDVFDVKPVAVASAVVDTEHVSMDLDRLMTWGFFGIAFEIPVGSSVLQKLNRAWHVAEDGGASVSVGDVFYLGDERFLVIGDGFCRLREDVLSAYERLSPGQRIMFVYSVKADYRLDDLVSVERYRETELCYDWND